MTTQALDWADWDLEMNSPENMAREAARNRAVAELQAWFEYDVQELGWRCGITSADAGDDYAPQWALYDAGWNTLSTQFWADMANVGA